MQATDGYERIKLVYMLLYLLTFPWSNFSYICLYLQNMTNFTSYKVTKLSLCFFFFTKCTCIYSKIFLKLAICLTSSHVY